jgi:hypothetical protein
VVVEPAVKKYPGGEERLLVYTFCGIVSYFLVVYSSKGDFEITPTDLLKILPRTALVGIVVYALYRRVIGEFVLYPLQYLLHYIWTKVKLKLIKHAHDWTAYTFFTSGLGTVSWFWLDDAYGIARDFVEQEKQGTNFWMPGRVELHVLYLAALFAFCFAWSAWHQGDPHIRYYLGGALFFAVRACIRQRTDKARDLYLSKIR